MTRAEILQVAKPILFNTEMVKGILYGRKTMTRRVIKKPIIEQEKNIFLLYENEHSDDCFSIASFDDTLREIMLYAPYKPGQYLYVRETFVRPATHIFWYRATPPKGCENLLWKPSIHMPKEAARIFLIVTDVRVERLQDMDYMDAVYEGIDVPLDPDGFPIYNPLNDFAELWDTTIPKKYLEKYGWDGNPWVFVISFDRMEVK